jgi:conjugal transfer/entry exclusion protein
VALGVYADRKEESGMKRLFLAAALVVVLAAPARAQFGGLLGGGMQIVFDPQMYGRQAMQLLQESQTVTTLGQQLQNMVVNTAGGFGGAYQPDAQFLNGLGTMIADENGLSYQIAGVVAQMQLAYPAFAAAGLWPATVRADTLDTMYGVMEAIQQQALDFSAESAELQRLEFQNQTATGRMQVQQTIAEINLAMANQLQMARQLQMAQINQESIFDAYTVSHEQLGLLNSAALMAAPDPTGALASTQDIDTPGR